MKLKLSAIAAALLASGSLMAAEPTNQELLQLIKQQEEQIQALKAKVEKAQKKSEETDQKVEATVASIEENMSSTGSKVSIGGYGELHYNNIEGAEKIDFHRFVLYTGYEFTDKIRFFSELELEHSLSGDGKPGEVELEQAYVEIDLTEDTSLKSGLFLIPVGILNETHEPNTFYGVERNPVEKNIIPTTWWEGGAMIHTKFSDGFSADFAIHSGLSTPIDGDKAFLIRSGRQKVASAKAENFAFTSRLKYTAIPGLELAATVQHQTDITQGELDADANLFTAHAVYNTGAFGLRALYASWDIGGAEAAAVGRDEQSGYFIEPSYRINENFGIFASFSRWDNNAGDAADTEKDQTNFGVNYWPHENVVFKFDLESRGGAQDGDGFNVGIGYQF